MSNIQNRTLTSEELERFGAEIDALRARTVADLGDRDARHIRRVAGAVRYLELAGRALLMAGIFLPETWLFAAWLTGAIMLGLSKILDNMELGHNVIHGQYDWMGDPKFNGKTFEWDIVATSDNWRHTHNYKHHTYCNVQGMDDDIGYGVMRLFPEQRWSPVYLLQPFYAIIFALLFQWGVAIQNLKLGRLLTGHTTLTRLARQARPAGRKMARQLIKDYVVFPLLALPSFWSVFTGNLVANGIRNIWTYTIIFCGHFTSNVQLFPAKVLKNETRGHWYLRQIRGSSNLTGGKLMDLLSGNLSNQIEHHLFPDVPANRYAEMGKQVREICARYGIYYNTGSLFTQFGQVIWRIIRHAFPSRPQRQLAAA